MLLCKGMSFARGLYRIACLQRRDQHPVLTRVKMSDVIGDASAVVVEALLREEVSCCDLERSKLEEYE